MNTSTVGSMSLAESTFCREMREVFQATLDGRMPFITMATSLWAAFRTIWQNEGDLDTALARGFKPFSHAISATKVIDPKGTLSPSERSFVADADGFVDFALRNGLTFTTVASVLAHDLSEIAAHKFNLDSAIAESCVLPKVTGWAERNKESAGEAEEPLE
jgi:hypothetical protein